MYWKMDFVTKPSVFIRCAYLKFLGRKLFSLGRLSAECPEIRQIPVYFFLTFFECAEFPHGIGS